MTVAVCYNPRGSKQTTVTSCFKLCLNMDLDHRAGLVLLCLVAVLLLSGAAATRQLEAEPEATRGSRDPSQTLTYREALSNSSCHGFLIGIGTQKGGTTALWAYIADNAHPHLRVSKTKELGFWDSLHTKYAGCRVGDYLQLQTADMQEAVGPIQQQPDLPVCEAIGNWFQAVPAGMISDRPRSWGTSSLARLRPSKDCNIMQKILQATPEQSSNPGASPPSTAAAVSQPDSAQKPGAPGPSNSIPTAADLSLAVDAPVSKPWWWAWRDRATTAAGASMQQQHRLTEEAGQQLTSMDPALAESSGGRLSVQQDDITTTSSRRLVQAMGAASSAILGAPAQLELQDPTFPQPMYHADITPRYLFDPAVAPRVRSLLPEARIVVILRDPVARAISNFNMWWQKQASKDPSDRPKTTWSEMLAAQIDGEIIRLSACYASVGPGPVTLPDLSSCLGLSHPYTSTYDLDLFANRLLAQGLYADELQPWFELFPAESFLIWVSEDFKSDPAAHMQQLVRWLGLDMQLLDPKLREAGRKLKPVHGRKYDGAANAEVVSRMRRFFEPHNRRLFEMLEAKGFGAVAARMRQVWPQ